MYENYCKKKNLEQLGCNGLLSTPLCPTSIVKIKSHFNFYKSKSVYTTILRMYSYYLLFVIP